MEDLMIDGRRAFLAGVVALAAGPLWAAQQQGIPDASSRGGGQVGPPLTPQQQQRRDSGLDQPDSPDDAVRPPNADPHAVLKQNQKDIKKDMAELESLVGDLRKQVDTIDSSNVLSMDLVHKAEAIEKLAHQIKTLASGA
jgi:hypothetical protein